MEFQMPGKAALQQLSHQKADERQSRRTNDSEAAFFERFCNVVLVLILNRKTRGCPCGCVTSFRETGNDYR